MPLKKNPLLISLLKWKEVMFVSKLKFMVVYPLPNNISLWRNLARQKNNNAP